MRPLPHTQDFKDIAKRIIWFEPPEVALCNAVRFMAYAFRYATFEDMQILRRHFNDDDLLSALTTAPPGIIDARSWSYWHVLLGVFPPPSQKQRVY